MAVNPVENHTPSDATVPMPPAPAPQPGPGSADRGEYDHPTNHGNKPSPTSGPRK